MTEWARRRFWKSVDVQPADAMGFAVVLDGRSIRTPAKSELILPTEACARLVAEEWRAQTEVIIPDSMPATRAANSAIDKVRLHNAEVCEIVCAYGDCDLVCYRADAPADLVAREAAAWDPLLDWLSQRHDARLNVVKGVLHSPQPARPLARLREEVAALGPFELTALHDLVAMSGSLIIGLAALDGFRTAEDLWDLSRVDEEWQIAQWGRDQEAESLAEGRKAAFLAAQRFFVSLQG